MIRHKIHTLHPHLATSTQATRTQSVTLYLRYTFLNFKHWLETFYTKHYVHIGRPYLGYINSPWATSPIKQHQVAHTKLIVVHRLCQPKCDCTNLPHIICRLTLKSITWIYPTHDHDTNQTIESHHPESLSLVLWFLQCPILRHISLSAWF